MKLISAFLKWNKAISKAGKPFSRLQKSQKYAVIARKFSTKFHFKVRKPCFKLRKAFFKGGLERNGKIKNVLEFDVEKDDSNSYSFF